MKRGCFLILVVATLLISGCAGTSDRQRTVGGGAVTGAAVGGIVGYLAGDRTGAVVGALVGGAAGALVGHVVAERKAQYASREDYLDAEAERVAEYNATASEYNEQLRQDIARLSQEAENLRAEYLEEDLRQEMLAERRSELKSRLKKNAILEEELAKELEIQMAILEEERDSEQEDDPYIAQLEQEVLELQANLEFLREGSIQLAGIDERLSI